MEKLLTKRDLAHIGISNSTIRRWVAKGAFPEPIYVGNHRRWLQSEVKEWLEGKKKERKDNEEETNRTTDQESIA